MTNMTATTTEEQETQQPQQADEGRTVLGYIDENTPVGRVFEFDPGGLEPFSGGERLKVDELETAPWGGKSVIFHDPDHPAHASLRSAIPAWNNGYAPKCIGYTDPDGTEAEGEPDTDEKAKDLLTPPLIDDRAAKALFAARDEVKEAEANVSAVKEELKEAKDELDVAQNRLNALIDEARNPNAGLPLFGDDEEPQPESETTDDAGDESESDAWRSVELGTLSDPCIPPKIVVTLAEQHDPPIRTLGDLADWQLEKGDFWMKDIKGLGPAGAKKIEDATLAYYQREGESARDQEGGQRP